MYFFADKIIISGGLELLFNKQTKLDVELPGTVTTIKDLVFYMKEKYLTEKPELFISGDSVYVIFVVIIFFAGDLAFWCSSMKPIGNCLIPPNTNCKKRIKLFSFPHSMADNPIYILLLIIVPFQCVHQFQCGILPKMLIQIFGPFLCKCACFLLG